MMGMMTFKMFETGSYRLVVKFSPAIQGRQEEKLLMAWEHLSEDALGVPCWRPVAASIVVENYVRAVARDEYERQLLEGLKNV